jgi:uncharacterized protein YmfQ (DUF2313 family)
MPSPPLFGSSDYQQAMLKLLPRGRAWRRDTDSVLVALLGALAPTYVRSNASANQLLVDTLPTTTLNLLPEWEESLGIPDACTPTGQTVAQRQQAVSAKWAARGGQSQAYFIKLALTLGYVTTITQFTSFKVGMRVGLPIYGAAWDFAWQVNVPTYTPQYFRTGINSTGDALATFGSTYLQCRLRALAPAHTTVIFNYS